MASKLKIIIYFIATIITVSACNKNHPTPDNGADPTIIDKTKTYLNDPYENRLKDSVWYYYKILSLWQEAIPPTTHQEITKLEEKNYIQNNFTQYFKNADNVLDYLMLLTDVKQNKRKHDKDYDWYSFLDRGSQVSSSIQETMSSGLGLSVFYLKTASSGNNRDLFIRSVDKGSSADVANLQRGDQILSINGDTNVDYDYQLSRNYSPLLMYLNLSSIKVIVKKQNGNIVETYLNHKYYNSNPILTSKIININQKKIGYFVLNSFASIKNRLYYTSFYYDLESLFNDFENNGINELIIDLRNNGGGDVETAEYLANRIAPANLSGSIMYTYEVNQFIKSWGWLNEGEEFAPIKFKKRGTLNVKRIYFLVSSNTASASELLINSLSPVMPTYMIGTYSLNSKKQEVADKTYGKPVGFFGSNILKDNVELYVSSFKMYNSIGKGDYFDGLTPNTHVWEFTQFYDYGNEKETMLASALSHIKTGYFNSSSLKASSENRSTKQLFREVVNIDNESSHSKSRMFKFQKEGVKK